jgi:hypothetical protein
MKWMVTGYIVLEMDLAISKTNCRPASGLDDSLRNVSHKLLDGFYQDGYDVNIGEILDLSDWSAAFRLHNPLKYLYVCHLLISNGRLRICKVRNAHLGAR